MRKRLPMVASAFALVAFLTVTASAKEITVRGHLAQTVEAGGWLIIADIDGRTEKYLLLNANSFQKESWFRVGALVEATGELQSDVVTIYQEGVPFEARTLRSVSKPRAAASINKRKASRRQIGSRRARTIKRVSTIRVSGWLPEPLDRFIR